MRRYWNMVGWWHNSEKSKNNWSISVKDPGNQISVKDTEHQGQEFWSVGRKNPLQTGFYKFTIGCRWWLEFGLYFQGFRVILSVVSEDVFRPSFVAINYSSTVPFISEHNIKLIIWKAFCWLDSFLSIGFHEIQTKQHQSFREVGKSWWNLSFICFVDLSRQMAWEWVIVLRV